jgi:hypothetical protein
MWRRKKSEWKENLDLWGISCHVRADNLRIVERKRFRMERKKEYYLPPLIKSKNQQRNKKAGNSSGGLADMF